MRLVDFLILVLEAHAETLKRLSLIVGEDELIEAIEAHDSESIQKLRDPTELKALVSELTPDSPHRPGDFHGELGDPYRKLEGAVLDFELPPVLEFYLWAYAPYRVWIESGTDLGWKIPGPGGELGTRMVETLVTASERWIQTLPLPRELMFQAEHAARVPWLKFRTQALKQIGRRPLGPVY